MESILTSIKKLLGITEDYDHFDADIIMHINSVFTILTQIGVGPSKGFRIEDDTATWDDFIPTDLIVYDSIKTYIYLQVKLLFDPPQSGTTLESYNRRIKELEWRLNVTAESQ
jgi:hypothetical protein